MERLVVRGLKTYFFLDEGIVKAVDGVDLTVHDRQTVGIIGESGCGKSATAYSLLRLIAQPGEIVDGTAHLTRKNGTVVDVLGLSPKSRELRAIRGSEISIVFQEPMTSFSPVHTIGFQIAEMVELHTGLSGRERRDYVVDLLARVGISSPRERYGQYPHELSGGMRQRAMIAMALSCKPKILIADEPTTALDVTIQAQILDLMKQLQDEEDMSAIYISHNLGLVAEQVDYIYVMYLGRVVESAPTRELFANPLHPYTQRLLRSAPQPGRRVRRLEVIEGSVPAPIGRPPECGFSSRCSSVFGHCTEAVPALRELEPNHFVRCFLHGDQEQPDDEWTQVGVA